MTREKAKILLPLINAYADGAIIQRKPNGSPHWIDLSIPLFDNLDPKEDQYRIKPEPKLRAWRADDVPMNCWVREKESPNAAWLIGFVAEFYVGLSGRPKTTNYTTLLTEFEHSTDMKNWKPCGVTEE